MGFVLGTQAQHQKQLRKKNIKSLLLLAPLLTILLVFFLFPISSMLNKSFYNPIVSEISPKITNAVQNWHTTQQLPNESTFKVMAFELQTMYQQKTFGRFAAQVNHHIAGVGSVIKRSARKLKKIQLTQISDYQSLLVSISPRWGELDMWRGIKTAAQPYSINYYLNALDLKTLESGEIVQKPAEFRVYVPILKRTFWIAFLVTLFALLLAYPLAYYLSMLPEKKANLLIVLVLLPFWTSLLVRTTSWIVILQNQGVVNGLLQYFGWINEPLDLIYNQFSTLLSMTHILLPFMILPLYSVMRGIDNTLIKASKSLGGNAFYSFLKIYFPLSVPGVSAGALLVFILAIGYYITPALLGGTDGQLISNLIAFHMRSTNNWEMAAALGSILLLLIIALYWVYDRFVGVSNLKL
ncbi:Spermidine Putrescine ABC transporter permease component PotB (TC 3.A.1.11.1) [uncultured Candidatus Thioglobus sp.]|nr:Spermidine Putrescine ABC transporter permease component PotB (TC 3.A.1.11.1) [uncultured Candidatus Thioglobus sp.]